MWVMILHNQRLWPGQFRDLHTITEDTERSAYRNDLELWRFRSFDLYRRTRSQTAPPEHLCE